MGQAAPKKSINKKKALPWWKKAFVAFLTIVLLAGGLSVYLFHLAVYQANITLTKDSVFFYVGTGSTFKQVTDDLVRLGYLRHRNTFEWLAEQKKYPKNVRPGRYRLKQGMSNNELVNLLRAGLQEPVSVTFNNIRLKEDLASRIGRLLEADSAQLMAVMNDSEFASRHGVSSESLLTLLLPNTYEMWWNTNAHEFFEKMVKEYQAFWTAERIAKARKLGLSPTEVTILASIVEKESNRPSEWPIIAGVYLNRLRKGMALQADPTLVFANRDFTARRVLNHHKQIDSPYNTYRYTGLPPGPICLAQGKAIDAVLNTQNHSYIYFCAKPDGSGYHDFAVTYDQHLANARAFHRDLNKRGIKN